MKKTKPKKKTGKPRGRPPGTSKRFEFDPEEFLKELPHMEAVQWVDIECPYCAETFDTRVDPSMDYSNYVENCQVCCKPMMLNVESVDGQVDVYASRC